MKLKKCVSLILSFVLVVGVVPMTAFAESKEIYAPEIDEGIFPENVNISELNGPDISEIQAPSRPSRHKNLSSGNTYTAILDELAASMGSYTKYYFSTGEGIICLECDLERSGTTKNKNRKLKIELYEKDDEYSYGRLFITREVSFTTDVHKTVLFAGLDPDRFYFVRFVNVSSNSAGSQMDISAEILMKGTYKKK